MINKAWTKFPTIDFRIGDACKLPFNNDTFDYILFSFMESIICVQRGREFRLWERFIAFWNQKGYFYLGHIICGRSMWSWVIKQKHIMAVRSVEMFAAFTILEIENSLHRVCLIFYRSIQSKKIITKKDFSINILLLLIDKRVVTSVLCLLCRAKERYIVIIPLSALHVSSNSDESS